MFGTMNSPNRNMAIVKAVRHQGRSPSKVAKQFGISRQCFYQILTAFEASGVKVVAPKSRARILIHRPRQISCGQKLQLSVVN